MFLDSQDKLANPESTLLLFNGKVIDMPPAHGAFKKAKRIKKTKDQQGKLGI